MIKKPTFKHGALVAVSGTGKNTVSNEIFAQIPELILSISCTSRKPRPGEIDGKNYYFLSKEEFLQKIENKEFAEWNRYGDDFYGTLYSEIDRIEKLGKTILFDVDINGAVALKKSLGDRIVTIFLYAPIEVSEQRLRDRGTESEEKIIKRLAIGVEELKRKGECDYVLNYGIGAISGITANEAINLMEIPFSL